MNKASDNMLLSATELQQMYHEQQAEIYNEEQNRIMAEQAAIERERAAYFEQHNAYVNGIISSGESRSERMTKIKEAFVSECIYKLYCESVAFPMTSRDKTVARNLVNKFVIENGAGNLIHSFATENMILSEFSRISQKYFNRVLESCDKHEDCEFTGEISGQIIHQDVVDDFYKELHETDLAILKLLINGNTQEEIAGILGFKTHSAVNKRIKRIRSKYFEFDPDFKKEYYKKYKNKKVS